MTNNPTPEQLQDADWAMRVLSKHNRWRLGSDDPPTDPKELTEAIEIAIKALRFTAKALGEPSEDMRKAVREIAKNWDDEAEAIIFGSDVTFKAMIQQLAKEVADE